jgi:hypothetical protein
VASRLEVRLMRRLRAIPLALAAAVGLTIMGLFVAFPASIPAGDPVSGDKAARPSTTAPTKTPTARPSTQLVSTTPLDPADNSYCLVCHLSYETEKLTHGHEKAGVGCADCHGESAKHSGDEDGLTPPDKMFAKSDVDGFCMTCHPKDKVLAKDKQSKNEYHKDVFDPKAEGHLICTECHGENHKIEVRTRKWDKKTRKLLSDDGVRMMYKNSPATEGVRPNQKKP